ncbi:probable E3 ubiquitin-protein ligase RNF144A-A [Triplophysa dalaica]|uniref:probable E3 ubiquitin-protein ligase RNF144A-A n=1 Tax=Triplophysa dalaica TaxID=1582913 RepID=UPI0024E01D99|nr:probable E3 ubiquitin-protein ligase RNF144A-A [Triplophysa dalaica]XP_056602372.1 probable E3 ubiquitin-protein ligase RNF144A-A [Triplophysa dalaica]
MDIIKCPGCHHSSKRTLNGQRVVCKTCSKSKKCVFQFCYVCQREWPRDAMSTDECVLPNCALRAALLSAKQIDNPESSVRGCPYFRACPRCKALLTHDSDGCPYIVCSNCNEEFCFRCMAPECDYDECYDSDFDDNEFEVMKPCVIKNNSELLQQLGL